MLPRNGEGFSDQRWIFYFSEKPYQQRGFMKILLIGGGGREHAIAWKLSQSAQVDQIWVAPGNGGTARLPKTENVALDVDDLTALRDFAHQQAVDLTIVGPEAPLVAGIVDLFQAVGLKIFGPNQAAAQLEGSKAFAKEFMQRHHIATGQAAIFSDFDEAMRYLRQQDDDTPVIKASGLAAGKGVLLPVNKIDAAGVIKSLLEDRRFGAASDTILIEERLEGPELSVLAFCDGKTVRTMPAAQDYKRLLDRNQGPNTGGMGAFAPAPLATPQLMTQIEQEVLLPTLTGMAAEGVPYVGVLYAGLMLTKDGPKVLEFNCRFGDPETEVILPLLESDLIEILLACINGTLEQVTPRWQKQAAVTVVMASKGYPNDYATGSAITLIEQAEAAGCQVFHAGTKLKDQRILTDGGRVLAVTGTGATISKAASQAYTGVSKIHFNGAHYRKDIGQGIR